MPRMPSASMLSRAIACPASLVLPQLPKETSDAAQRGTEIHSYLANQVDDTQQTLPLSEETANYVERLDITHVLAGRAVYAAETTFIYTPETQLAAQVPKGAAVDYRNSLAFIGGTADLILQEPDGRWVILDWKSGVAVEHPRENKQLLFFAFCLAKLTGNALFAGEIAFLDPVTSKVTLVRAEYTPEQIDAFGESLHKALAMTKEAEDDLYSGRPIKEGIAMGEHCKYCPAFTLCPAQRHIAQAISHGSTLGLIPVMGAIGFMTPKQAGIAWQRLKELRQLIGMAEYELRAYAEDTPIELPNGGKVQIVPSTRESLNANIAREVLAERGGPTLAEAASTYHVSKASIKRALKAKGLPSGKKEVDILLEIMEDRGGVHVSHGLRLKNTLPSGAEGKDEPDENVWK